MQELKESMEFFKTAAECWSQIIETQINLYYSTLRLIMDNDAELRALRRCHNQNVSRLERVERAMREDGLLS